MSSHQAEPLRSRSCRRQVSHGALASYVHQHPRGGSIATKISSTSGTVRAGSWWNSISRPMPHCWASPPWQGARSERERAARRRTDRRRSAFAGHSLRRGHASAACPPSAPSEGTTLAHHRAQLHRDCPRRQHRGQRALLRPRISSGHLPDVDSLRAGQAPRPDEPSALTRRTDRPSSEPGTEVLDSRLASRRGPFGLARRSALPVGSSVSLCHKLGGRSDREAGWKFLAAAPAGPPRYGRIAQRADAR